MSAYMSELAALAHPVSAHVMSAEMHNPGINSLALISPRRTTEAVDLFAHMSACHIDVSCQAVEIRTNHVRFLSTLRTEMEDFPASGAFHGLELKSSQIETLCALLLPIIQSSWFRANSNTWKDRVLSVVDAVMSSVNEFVATHNPDCSVSMIIAFRKYFQSLVSNTAGAMFHPSPTISPEEVATQLGRGTSQLYSWVRAKLNIPMNCSLQDDPLYNAQECLPIEGKKSIGSSVSIVYESLLKGEMMDTILDGLKQDKA